MRVSLHSPSPWRPSLTKCLGQTHGVRTGTGKPRQNTLRETDDARTKTAEKTQKSALRGRLSLDNRGPSMWPYLSSPFYCLPHLVPYWSLWKVQRERVPRPVLVAS